MNHVVDRSSTVLPSTSSMHRRGFVYRHHNDDSSLAYSINHYNEEFHNISINLRNRLALISSYVSRIKFCNNVTKVNGTICIQYINHVLYIIYCIDVMYSKLCIIYVYRHQ